MRAAWRLGLYVLALVAAGAVAQAVLYPMVDALSTASGVRFIAYPWLTLLAALMAHVVMLRGVERRAWSDVGLGRRALRWRGLALGGVVGSLAIALPVALLLGAGWLRVIHAAGEGWNRTAASLLVTLAPAALFEELIVRGYPLMVLRESAGEWIALVSTSVVFGLLHLQNPGATATSVAMVTLAGLFLGAVLIATESLWAAFAAHLAWNWTLSAVLHAAVSGLPFATPGYQTVDTGPDWATGGVWGPEGGLAAGAGMLAALALLRMRRPIALFRTFPAGGRSVAGAHSHE